MSTNQRLKNSSSRLRNAAYCCLALASTTFHTNNSNSVAHAYGKMTFTTTRTDGVITISPKNESKQSALVVICHGLGDSAEGFADVAEQLATAMPYCKFVLPTAPTQPVTMNMGMPMPSWYDIVGLDERSNENCKGIDRSKETVLNILHKEHESVGLPYARMMVMGFSQGGALSLFTGLSMASAEQKLAGIVVMSGYLAGSKVFKLTEGLEDTPIFHGHGTSDPMVQYTMATRSKEMLTELGVTNYTLKAYQGLQHSVNPQELQDVMQFILGVLPENKDKCYVTVKDPGEMSVKELKAAIRNAGLGSQAVGFMEKSEFVKLLRDFRANN